MLNNLKFIWVAPHIRNGKFAKLVKSRAHVIKLQNFNLQICQQIKYQHCVTFSFSKVQLFTLFISFLYCRRSFVGFNFTYVMLPFVYIPSDCLSLELRLLSALILQNTHSSSSPVAAVYYGFISLC